MKRIPKPKLVTADMGTFTAYAWRIDYKIPGDVLSVLGDTQQECKNNFVQAYFEETGINFN